MNGTTKLIVGIIGIAIALYVLFVLLKPAAIAPNGELSNPTPKPSSIY